MDKFTILKLYRAIGLSYIKIDLFNSAIGILSHYVETLLKMKEENPSKSEKIDKELDITRDVMQKIFRHNKENLTNPLEDKDYHIFKTFSKTFEDTRMENFHQQFSFLMDNKENGDKSLFKFYAINLKFIQESLTNKTEDEEMLSSGAQQLFFLEQFDLALDFIKYLQKKYPKNTYSFFLKGQCLWQLKEYKKALAEFNKLLKISDSDGFLYNYVGKLYSQLYDINYDRNNLTKAIELFNKACELTVDNYYLYEKASTYLKLGDIKEAKKTIHYFLKQNPSDSEIATFLWPFIQCGDFENYKKYIDLRLSSDYIGEYYPKIMNKPMWDCKKDISDKTLLVVVEQGYGDIFMYCRSLNIAKEKAKKVIFLTRPSTVRLFQYNYPDIEVLPITENLDNLNFDYHVPLMSLIKFWDFSKPAEAYLSVDPQDVRKFRIRHVDQLKFNIGVMYTSYVGDYFGRRNIPLKDLQILTKTKDAKLYSFAVDSTLFNPQRELGIESLGMHFFDFYDTAVALKAMHVVVSTDNVILNLAGAMGIKTFGLLNKFNVGRWWKKEGDDIGWYKSVKPLTAKHENEWDKLLARTNEYLQEYRISLRESYLNTIIKNIENDKTTPKEIQNAKKSTVVLSLWKETFNKKYLDEYVKLQNKQLKLNPEDVGALGNIATYYAFLYPKRKEANKIFDSIIDKLDSPELLFNYACLKCSLKDFDSFFKYYEYRFKKAEPTRYPEFSQPRWNGETNTKDKTLLVHFEQGYGDTILFSRYLNDVKKLFKKVYFVVRPNIKDLIKNSFPDIVVDINKDIETDYQIPLMSLPGALKSYPDKYKNNKKWLKADEQKIEEFKQYFDNKKYNVGIFWNSTRTLTQRYADLKTMLPLGHIKNVQLYSLEINREDAELNYIDDKVNIINLGKHFKDFSDTAAAIENCDLVVSTDSAVLNLAGALGKKTFGLFSECAEWRWYKLDGEDTGWYKSVKPFHAAHDNNFKPEITKICKEIKDIMSSDKRFSNK